MYCQTIARYHEIPRRKTRYFFRRPGKFPGNLGTRDHLGNVPVLERRQHVFVVVIFIDPVHDRGNFLRIFSELCQTLRRLSYINHRPVGIDVFDERE